MAKLISRPGIVHIFDCGDIAPSVAYLAVDLLDDETLWYEPSCS